jgi:hypothetical protein
MHDAPEEVTLQTAYRTSASDVILFASTAFIFALAVYASI